MQQQKTNIYIIGGGGIVNTAHLPAYKIAGFTVAGIFDVDNEKATATALRFTIPVVFTSLAEMIAAYNDTIIFDIAVPADELPAVLAQLPEHSKVLMQKPMGVDIDTAKQILSITRIRKLTAAVNFQLRYAPFIIAAKKIIEEGLIGELCDIEVNVNVVTPWHIWKFLYTSPRVEILYHSIHYIDLIRNLLGNPVGVYAKTVKHPLMEQLASVRSNIIMDYGSTIRANILTNHCHDFGLQHQHSYIKLEGTKGAIKIKLGSLMNYPQGVDDIFEYVIVEEGTTPKWKTLTIEGSWFPHAFIGSMQQLIDVMEGKITVPDNSVEDCINTMICVEAAYCSDTKGGIAFKDII